MRPIYILVNKILDRNDTYGWLPPIDTFVQCGYGLTIYEGGTEFTKPLFRGPQKEKAPAK
jgi:hypothetical protein